MAENSAISWTTHTFNPVRGCAEVSPGCDHCYAREMAKRNPATLGVWGPQGTRIIASESMWQAPVKWNAQRLLQCSLCGWRGTHAEGLGTCPECHAVGQERDPVRPRVFCASLADVFEDWTGRMHYFDKEMADGIAVAWWRKSIGLCQAGQTTIDNTDGERLAAYDDVRARLFALIEATPNLDWLLLTKRPENVLRMVPAAWQKKFPPHVWMGVTVEDQPNAGRLADLLRIPAAVHLVSNEPSLGPVDFERIVLPERCEACTHPVQFNAFTGKTYCHGGCDGWSFMHRLHWIITGGESGPGHRTLDLDALASLAGQCTAAGVPLFVKQDSGAQPGRQGRIPADLWARKEFPTGERSRA